MEIKGYSAFPKALVFFEPHHQNVESHILDTRYKVGSYPSAEKQSEFSTAPADGVREGVR